MVLSNELTWNWQDNLTNLKYKLFKSLAFFTYFATSVSPRAINLNFCLLKEPNGDDINHTIGHIWTDIMASSYPPPYSSSTLVKPRAMITLEQYFCMSNFDLFGKPLVYGCILESGLTLLISLALFDPIVAHAHCAPQHSEKRRQLEQLRFPLYPNHL